MRKRGRQWKKADQESRGGLDLAGWGQKEDDKGHQHKERYREKGEHRSQTAG